MLHSTSVCSNSQNAEDTESSSLAAKCMCKLSQQYPELQQILLWNFFLFVSSSNSSAQAPVSRSRERKDLFCPQNRSPWNGKPTRSRAFCSGSLELERPHQTCEVLFPASSSSTSSSLNRLIWRCDSCQLISTTSSFSGTLQQHDTERSVRHPMCHQHRHRKSDILLTSGHL